MASDPQVPFEADGAERTKLRGWSQGTGPLILLAHGITAHRDLVVHGSTYLPRVGYRLVSYDARAHGDSDPGRAGSYSYSTLANDLEAVEAFSEQAGQSRPLLCGHSMGAHTILASALRDPERYAGLVLVGPASTGERPSEAALAGWDALADGLAEGGVEGWLRAYEAAGLNPEWRETLLRIARARMERHQHPEALAEALREVPRSIPFDGLDSLESLELPTLVVGSRDEADPGHPLAVAEAVAGALPQARLVVEPEGESPLAWQGGKLSREIAEFAGSVPVAARLGE